MNAHRWSGDSAASLDPESTAAVLAAVVGTLRAASDTPQLEAEVLLAFVTGRARSSLLAFPERRVAPGEAQRFAELAVRRAAGEPLAYLTGEREFFSLALAVTPAVLVPRPETELLVDETLARCAALPCPTVLDLGTGSGAIALAVKHERPAAVVTAVDVSEPALAVARANAARLALDVRWLRSSWFEALGSERFDAIVSNPPYVASADVAGALAFEPRLALDGGADGYVAYREILALAPAHLAPGGALLLEHGHAERAALAALAEASGWCVAGVRDDLAGRARVLVLTRGPP
jgi:release factor glutamine methyltransferase